jgi:hypothetical protein
LSRKFSNDAQIRSLKPMAGHQYDAHDTKMRGFSVRVSPGGTISFFIWYRVGRKGRRYTLGKFPTIKLAEAREQARLALQRVAQGKDPAAEKQMPRTIYGERLFSVLVTEFIEDHVNRNTRSWRETERILAREFAIWSKWPIDDISRRDVSGILSAIVKRGSPSSANHALAAVRAFFNWAVAEVILIVRHVLASRLHREPKVVNAYWMRTSWRAFGPRLIRLISHTEMLFIS